MEKPAIFILALVMLTSMLSGQKTKLIIDADTGNEIDDALALVLALKSDELDILAISAGQWKYQLYEGLNTALISWEQNHQILDALGIKDIPCLQGAERPLTRKQLGGLPNPRWTDGGDYMIEKAMQMPEGEKLIIICMGAVTNVVSAFLKEPGIIDKIAVYFCGSIYDFESRAWNKNEFNIRNDLNAFDVLLNTDDLELHVFPANIAGDIVFEREQFIPGLDENVKIEKYLKNRWEKVVKGGSEWIMWDLAIIEAIIHPEWVEEIVVSTPPENVQRKVGMYKQIDVEKVMDNFWLTLKK